MKIVYLVIMLLIAVGCEEYYIDEYYCDTESDTATDTDTVDTDCALGDACTVSLPWECYVSQSGDLEWVRHWGGCVCVDGEPMRTYEDEVCPDGCVVNPNGYDYCK